MSSSEEDDGPRLVWTFPIIRILTRERRILNIASRVRERNGGVIDRVQDRSESVSESSSIGESEEESDNRLNDIQNEISELSDDSEIVFEQAEDVTTISIQDEVFVPTTVEISVGDTVEWENEDDEVYNVMSVTGEDFSSGQLEPGETFSNTFDEEEAVIFIDSIRGGSVVCGAVLVGDVELDQPLPCEEGAIPEPFDASGVPRSMEEAAEDRLERKEEAFQ